MQGRIGIIVAVLVIGVAVFTLSSSRSNLEIDGSEIFKNPSLVDYEGETVVLETFLGKSMVINSWAVWCPFCRDELPDFAELQREFEGRIVVIAIDRQEPLAKVKSYTDGLGVSDELLFLLDSEDSFYRSIGGFSMPETIFVNASGEIVVHKRGPMDLQEMREHVEKILTANQTS